MSIQSRNESMPLWLAVLPIIMTVALLSIQLLVFNSFDPQAPLMFGIFFSVCAGLLRGWKWKDMEDGMFKIIVLALPAIAILLLIGVLIGSWIASGTVPYLVYWGLKMISPEIFLFSAFILCSIMSLALGTSWGTIATLGIVIVGIGQTMGFPIWLSAAPVVSGAFFGDKMSPISDTTNLAPAITGTQVYEHIKNMVPTTVPAMIIGAIIYLIIGYTYSVPTIDIEQTANLLTSIENSFDLSILALLPPLVIVILALSGFSALPAMFCGILVALILAFAQQGLSIASIFEIIRSGYVVDTGNDISNNIFNRGGIVSMSDTISLVFFALTFGGILERLKCFETISKSILKKIKHFWQLQVTAISGTFLMIIGTGDSYLPMAFIGRLFSKAYDKLGYSRLNLSRAIEEGGTLLAPLVPWSASGIFISTTLGLGISEGNTENLLYIPLSFGCWLSPLLGMIFPIFGLFSKKATKTEIESYETSESIKANISQPFNSFLKWYNPPVSAYVSTPDIAIRNNVADIKIPLAEVLEHGNMGFAISDGDYIIINDGQYYRCDKDCQAIKENKQITLEAVNLTHFSKDFDENISKCNDADILKVIPNIIPSENMIYGMKIKAVFNEIQLSSGKEKGCKYNSISGTAVGFFYPDYINNIASGLNLFFLSEDNTIAGKIIASKTKSAFIELKQISRLQAGLPISLDFLTTELK